MKMSFEKHFGLMIKVCDILDEHNVANAEEIGAEILFMISAELGIEYDQEFKEDLADRFTLTLMSL